MKGFCVHIEHCSAFIAELWGMLCGLEVAWDLGIQKLEVESDSQTIISCIIAAKRDGHRHTLICLILDWTNMEWEVSFNRTYREGNICAEWLANWALRRDPSIHVLDSPPRELASLISYDCFGDSIPCVIYLIV